MLRPTIILSLVVLCIGCKFSGYSTHSGDVILFLAQEVKNAGGQVADLETEGTLQTEWRFKKDSNGFQMLLPSKEKESLVKALALRFGDPVLRDTYPHLVYKVQDLGVAIMIDLEQDPIHLICLKKGALP